MPDPGDMTAASPAGSHPTRDDDAFVTRTAVQVAAILKTAKERKPATAKSRFIKFANSGIGVLIAGSIVTSVLVPFFQSRSEERQARRELAQKLLSAFLEYENTPWEEYHVVLPLEIAPRRLTTDRYEAVMTSILAVKLRRYDALAALDAMAIKLDGQGHNSKIQSLVDAYATKVNTISDTLAKSVGTIYCATGACSREADTSTYTPLSKIEDMIHNLDGDQAEIVAELATASR
jgi:hypothetical protein